MSNSAAAQEPSMEEILASIRRIITDEEGEPKADQEATDQDSSDEQKSESDDLEMEDGLLSSGEPMTSDDLDALFSPESENDIVPEQTVAKTPEISAAQPAEPKPDVSSNEDDEVMELTVAEIDEDAIDMEDDLELEIVEGMDIVFDETDEDELPAAVVATPEPKIEAPQTPEPVMEANPIPAPQVRSSTIENLISNHAATSVSESFSSLSGLVVSNQAKTMEDLLKEMLRPMLQSWLDENLPPLVENMVAAEIRRLSGKK